MHAMLQEASAQTSRLYFAGYLGLTTSGDQEFTESSIPRSGDIETKNANSFAGALGVRLSRQFRIEGEISYSAADMDRMDINNVGSFEMAGELTTWTALINAYYDFDVDWDLQPFIGAGLGISWHEGDINDLSGLALDTADDTTRLTWQMGGGLKYRVGPDLAFSGAYRYLGSTDLDFGTYNIDYNNHEIRIGLEYDLPVH